MTYVVRLNLRIFKRVFFNKEKAEAFAIPTRE